MTLAAGPWLLVSSLLVLGVLGSVPEEELSELQTKAVRLVMENFHRKNNPKNGYKLSTIEQESEYELDDGLFVSLELTLKQTKCQKEELKANPNCKMTRDGKTYSCVGCFKFEFWEQKVLSRYVHCIPPARAIQERIVNLRRDNCKALRKPKKQTPVYNVGSVSFLRAASHSLERIAMGLAAGMWGLVSALLVLGVWGSISLQELPGVQQKAAKLMMEDFHKKDLKNSFRFTSVIKATEEESTTGMFVNMELLLKQTVCRKHLWKSSNCQIAANPVTFNCFACFKFEYQSLEVISQFISCIPEKKLTSAQKQTRENKCEEVSQKANVKSRFPGVYSFLKSE
ncbi:retinoic acid receptor responder protein 2 [Hyperolius riggenbachi]|uniref:retinoic acid receptor responder protein 2 n=1 Tax=Hyperolius riggenbachi TaxID=752182 RepID=UPI0035A34D26